MEKIEKQCPYCHNNYKRLGTHFYCCEKLKNKTQDEIHLINIKLRSNNENILDDIKNEYINGKSLTDIKNKYDLDLKSICWCLSYQNVKIRSVSESYYIVTKEKIINTSRKKWGVDNPSQAKEIKDKKAATFMKHYGVDNIWKTKDYKKFTSQRWKNMSIEQKEQIIFKKWICGGYISDIEIRVFNLLKHMYKKVEPQYIIEGSNHKYDIYIYDINTIIEVNGDYWHLNPLKYKEDDFIQIGGYKIIAKEKWEIDKKHIEFAKQKNYIIYEIWEHDIVSRNDSELIQFMYNLLNN